MRKRKCLPPAAGSSLHLRYFAPARSPEIPRSHRSSSWPEQRTSAARHWNRDLHLVCKRMRCMNSRAAFDEEWMMGRMMDGSAPSAAGAAATAALVSCLMAAATPSTASIASMLRYAVPVSTGIWPCSLSGGQSLPAMQLPMLHAVPSRRYSTSKLPLPRGARGSASQCHNLTL